jgi:hypothetical protein
MSVAPKENVPSSIPTLEEEMKEDEEEPERKKRKREIE